MRLVVPLRLTLVPRFPPVEAERPGERLPVAGPRRIRARTQGVTP
jgi:hypothetical protein